jgi:fluoride ion exporter CrcB/FEX
LPLEGFLLVGVGAAREHGFLWDFGICLNPVFATVSLGALSANLLGGFIIGGMMSAADAPGFSPAVRLLVVTDFPGGSTTSSTYSAETAASLLQARYRSALAGGTHACRRLVVHDRCGSLTCPGSRGRIAGANQREETST